MARVGAARTEIRPGLGADRVPRRDSWGAGRLSPDAEARFIAGVEYFGRFFMGMADAQKALYKLTAILEKEGVPYAIIGRSH